MNKTPVLQFQQFISVDGDQLITDSLKVSSFHGKRHDNLIALIRHRINEAGNWGLLNFKETSYFDDDGRKFPMFTMTEKGYMFLVGKMTGKKAVIHQIAYAEAFDAMRALIKNQREGLQFQYFEADRKLKDRKKVASTAGRELNQWRIDSPALELSRQAVLDKMQPGLFLN